MINTAIERTIDLITEDFHPLARIAKDVAAGGVLIAAINSLIVGYLLFFDRLNPYTNRILFKIKKISSSFNLCSFSIGNFIDYRNKNQTL